MSIINTASNVRLEDKVAAFSKFSDIDTEKRSSSILKIVNLAFFSLVLQLFDRSVGSNSSLRVLLCNNRWGLSFTVGEEGTTMKVIRSTDGM